MDVRTDVHTDVRKDVSTDVRKDVRKDVCMDVRPDVRTDVCEDVRMNVRPDVGPRRLATSCAVWQQGPLPNATYVYLT